jgi:catechol 2,3-dioxygenase-like lactoylglutathione lyase family enzyme
VLIQLRRIQGSNQEVSSIIASSQICAFAPTTNAERAKEFYSEVLGLDLVSEDQYALVYDANGTMLRITIVPELTPHPFTVLGWNVADMSAAVTEMNSAGVVFEKYAFLPLDNDGVMTFPNGDKVAWFKDPDDNTLSIAQHA